MRRILPILAGISIALAFGAAPAAAEFLSSSQANGVADARGEAAYERTAWAEEWGAECERQTPWRFSCQIELWNEESGRECWQDFEVQMPIFGNRMHLAGLTRWYCRG